MITIIDILDIGKKYRIHTAASYLSLRDALNEKALGLFKKNKRKEDFWALKNINLKIEKGERIGIIGRNGAGKSTLLKIISRITPPTTGRIIMDGRVASLLEVGTGFHPELTGRENIYFNGSILGLKRKEINAKLDEIIDFSGIEKFIDSPLKHYSSGMQLRLAFSVAAHLEADILLIDEVLAVGDFEFQMKCIGKMEEVSRQGNRTIVFVSHNLAAVMQLCTRAIVLQAGEIVFEGKVAEAIRFYTNHFMSQVIRESNGVFNLHKHPNKVRPEEGLMKVSMYVNDVLTEEFIPGGSLKIVLNYKLSADLIDPDVGIVIKDADHHAVIGLNNKHLGKQLHLITGEEGVVSILIPELNIFRPGKYRVNLYFGDNHHFYECLYDAFEFYVQETDVYHSGNIMSAEWNSIYVPKIDFF